MEQCEHLFTHNHWSKKARAGEFNFDELEKLVRESDDGEEDEIQ
jgi:hypothetical protein